MRLTTSVYGIEIHMLESVFLPMNYMYLPTCTYLSIYYLAVLPVWPPLGKYVTVCIHVHVPVSQNYCMYIQLYLEATMTLLSLISGILQYS